VLIVPSAPVHLRNNDVEHAYRQSSDFYYLTGFDEPESVLVLRSKGGVPEATLFVRPKDPAREAWDGRRAGVAGACADSGFGEAYRVCDFDVRLPVPLDVEPLLFIRLGRGPGFDDRVLGAIDVVRRRARKGVLPPAEISVPDGIIHDMRLRRRPEELEHLLA